ncbi:MAG: hypothetical protein AAF604_11280 [Acidobacteriota bacterium]
MKHYALALAIAGVALVGSPMAAEVAHETHQQAELRLSVGGERGLEEFVVRVPVGSPARYERYGGPTLELVPTLLRASPDSKPVMNVEVYEVLELAGSRQPNLLGVVSAQPGKSQAIPGAGGLIALEGARLVAVPGPDDSDFRPRNCCISCGDNMLCGGSVDTSCGSCDVR